MDKYLEGIYENVCGIISGRRGKRYVENMVNDLYGRLGSISVDLDNMLYDRLGMSGEDIVEMLYEPHIEI